MTYQETLDYMFTQLPMYQRTGKAAYKADLDNTLAMDSYFNHPHKKFKSVHVAGTNGKGSVSHSIASVLQKSGLKVGLYTSPHLRDFRERIKINGEVISESAVIDFIANHKEKFEELKPSFFEMTVALAFEYFAKEEVDIAVIEVGLGGRLDSTNIITPLVSVITNISKDHTNLLGNDIATIAKEKGGIIKPGIPVVVGERQELIEDVFKSIAQERGSDIEFSEDCYQLKNAVIKAGRQELDFVSVKDEGKFKIECDLLGKYQQKNIRTAICAIDQLRKKGIDISDENLRSGLSEIVKETGLLGRWQILQEEPKVICDTGHNAAGIREIIEQIGMTDYRKLHVVFGLVDDKNTDEVLSLMPKEAVYYFTRASIPRALDEMKLKELANAYDLQGKTYPSVEEALCAAKQESEKEDLIFVGGSTFVVAEVV
ncbi:bifunctional folylpolyglutamate synthase/dihydrofolate synthase [Marinifilum caeruleilacunae]|uniref:Dihydrofolate synthase/folylpolyglutamate synthase n=1 Tax=Marinifilum caeruleilacunae TaxID=2499076 RepID=A0ABX1WW58_9BACT|nr:folylpolyglutamate synthase/dihydrofolate synthase family protein [Marinifilum caeruleilacunae]NOU60287.1 bifunctional folylpolyglutamate synthase/dihydrofolate synthase [Marinifilum caeruleilacunae]